MALQVWQHFDDQTIKALLPLDSRRDSVSTVELERASNAPKAIIILQDPRNGEMVGLTIEQSEIAGSSSQSLLDVLRVASYEH